MVAVVSDALHKDILAESAKNRPQVETFLTKMYRAHAQHALARQNRTIPETKLDEIIAEQVRHILR